MHLNSRLNCVRALFFFILQIHKVAKKATGPRSTAETVEERSVPSVTTASAGMVLQQPVGYFLHVQCENSGSGLMIRPYSVST